MKAIAYKAFGNVDVLQTIDEPKPSIKSNQVLVKVKANSINQLDWKIRKGEMKLMSGSKFPKHIGVDFSGIVDEIGNDVADFKKGDEVFGAVDGMKEGALSEYVAIATTSIWKKPNTISFTQAASIPIVGAGAVTALEKMGAINQQTQILINGATGGLGMFLLQLLKQNGATVTAVASNEGIAYAKNWGADVVIDYTKENVLNGKMLYDVVVDLSGKMGYANAKKVMKSNAVFVNPTPQPKDILLSTIANLFRSQKHKVVLSNPSTKNIALLLNAVSKGLQIEVSKTFPFSRVKEAYQFAEKGGYIGKLAIELN